MSVFQPHRFGDPVTLADVLACIAAPENCFGVEEDAPCCYGKFKALLCTVNIMGEILDRDTKEILHSRLAECHAWAKNAGPKRRRDAKEAAKYFLELATAVQMDLDPLDLDPPSETVW